MRWRRFVSMSFLAGAVVWLGCDDGPTRPPPEADGPGGRVTPGGGGGSTADGGARDDGGDGGACIDLVPEGAVIDQLAVAEDVAPGTGGAILDGTYDLTESRIFAGTGLPGLNGASYQATIRITGTRFERAIRYRGPGGATTETRADGTIAINGVNFTLSTTCPSSIQEQFTYSVLNSGNTLDMGNLFTKESFSFARRP